MDEFKLTSPVPVGGRESHDHYPSPAWTVRLLLEHLAWPEHVAVVLDPCCGEGSILDVARERGMRSCGLEFDHVRAEAARAAGHLVQTADALETPWPSADLLVTNPPYTLAEAFVRKALAWQAGRPRQTAVCALLRLSWLEPAGTRGDLFRTNPPDVLVLPRRPRFDGAGQDSVTSVWCCWPGEGRMVWL